MLGKGGISESDENSAKNRIDNWLLYLAQHGKMNWDPCDTNQSNRINRCTEGTKF